MNAAVFIDGGYLATILKNYGSPKVDYEKEIAAARESGDMVAVAALIRQQQMAEKQNE